MFHNHFIDHYSKTHKFWSSKLPKLSKTSKHEGTHLHLGSPSWQLWLVSGDPSLPHSAAVAAAGSAPCVAVGAAQLASGAPPALLVPPRPGPAVPAPAVC